MAKPTNRHLLPKIQVDFEHIGGFHGLLPTFVFGLKTPFFSHRFQYTLRKQEEPTVSLCREGTYDGTESRITVHVSILVLL